METYDPREVAVIVGGTIITGFSEGTFVQGEKSSQTYEKHVGAQGEVDRSRNADPTGQLTVTLKHISPSNAYLEELSNSQETFPARVMDRSTRTFKAGGGVAWVRNLPSFSRETGISNREWIIDVADYDTEEG